MRVYENKSGKLMLIPKFEQYMEYMLEVILLKLPRTEKFSIGTEMKNLMYTTYRNIMYLNKVDIKKKMYYLNLIDCDLNVQRTLIRIMYKYKWIDEHKFDVLIKQHLHEIGAIVGGLIKYYAKNPKEEV
ncbi:MAG: four helix bundle protein [Clostridia bacterium]|nr:four helix bundle protein [Clostridia bacterium]